MSPDRLRRWSRDRRPPSPGGQVGRGDAQAAGGNKDAAGTVASPLAASALLPYASLVIASDATTGALVLSFRDQCTGEPLYQDPSRTALQYQAAQTRQAGVPSTGADDSWS